MKIKRILIAILFVSNLSAQIDTIISQEFKKSFITTEILNFYPLAIGNKWIYDDTSVLNPDVTHHTYILEVLDDSLAPNGKLYFHLKERIVQYSDDYAQNFLERIDSLGGKVYGYSGGTNPTENEVLIHDLNLGEGDTITTFYPFVTNYYHEGQTSLFMEDLFNKWGLTKPRKTYHQWEGLDHLEYSLTQDIGLDYYSFHSIGTSSGGEEVLKGCVINGVIYGDTSVVSVEEENQISSNFILQQNYPNPFNPTTNIGFQIAEFGFVSLKVYDVLGREVAILVNEEKHAGNYEVKFSAKGGSSSGGDGNDLSSGIYFYKLQTETYTSVKKMILMK